MGICAVQGLVIFWHLYGQRSVRKNDTLHIQWQAWHMAAAASPVIVSCIQCI